MTGNTIRKKFIDYFISKGHTHVASASLVPQNDPTLFFTNAGMVPFKNVFTGEEKRGDTRACSSQKCMRVSGKHNDLENVGRTARHHTFFEMLGNFSFGDYFKKEAIRYAWDFLTNEVKLPKEKLWITVYKDDNEAFEIWNKDIGISADRIKRLGEKDNFWSMGETGPCGPCSEIHYEQDFPCPLNNPHCHIGECECDRFIEVWNLVFMQFNRDVQGSLTPLPKPCVDTGMGLERLATLVQGKQSNYDCDLFTPLLNEIQKLTHKKYPTHTEDDVSMRVLADHIRATTFLICDGVLPSNEGRGYVLRRIMRRAIRHGKLLGQAKPFFSKLVPVVVNEMSSTYPELATHQKTIEKVVHAEEERFFETLDKGLKLLSEEIKKIQAAQSRSLPGSIAFKLYDTYGFPPDLTEIITAENGIHVDQAEFDTAMNEQKERARAGWKGSGQAQVEKSYLELGQKHHTKFVGYDLLETNAKILALVQNGQRVQSVDHGTCDVIFDKTPCYAESGGQVGDQGLCESSVCQATILNTYKPTASVSVHSVQIISGGLEQGATIKISVNKTRRQAIACNHTATHLLHAALRKHLGTHVRQAGSFVSDENLRFDFSHFEALSPTSLREIENDVNAVILNNLSVSLQEMSHKEATQKGALAFFGEKYGEKVRVVQINDYSKELCGGTHLTSTAEIGQFRITAESSIAAGVRRIEAITGLKALALAQEDADILLNLTTALKSTKVEIADKIEKQRQRVKACEKDIEKLKSQLMQGGSGDATKNVFEVNGLNVLIHASDDIPTLRELALTLADKIKPGVVVLTAQDGPKAILVVATSKDIISKFPANKILSSLAPLINGRGGGKPDLAQAGGDVLADQKTIEASLRSTLMSAT